MKSYAKTVLCTELDVWVDELKATAKKEYDIELSEEDIGSMVNSYYETTPACGVIDSIYGEG